MKNITDVPKLYDLLYDNLEEDIMVYTEMLKGRTKVIEYGAGTGRITIPLAQKGIKVVALDNSDAMLNKLREKITDKIEEYIEIVNGDMVTYKHIEKVPAIIIPFSTFNYLLDKSEQFECIKNVSNNLLPDGEVIIELILKKAFHSLAKDDKLVLTQTIKNGDFLYEYWTNTKYNDTTNVVTQVREFRVFDKENNLIDKYDNIIWQNNILSLDEMSKLLEANGLNVEEVYGVNPNREDAFGNYDSECEYLFIKARRKNEVNS